MSTPDRLTLLRVYFDRLRRDVAAKGKFSASGDNPIETAVQAALSGSGAMATDFFADLQILAGEKAALAQPLVESLLARELERGVHTVAGKAVDFAASLLTGSRKRVDDPRAEERRAVGKKFMDTAKNLGKRRG